MRVVRTPSWSRSLFSGADLSAFNFGYGPSFWIGPYDPVTKSCVTFNNSGIKRRKRRKLRERRLVERTPVAMQILSSF